uniref:Polycystin 1 like 3, transient receptor potential channel interacting n=1 Tax=Chelonoidis abingdonii TaxID=106734 RepID=A0A8C0HFL9_CHEAB
MRLPSGMWLWFCLASVTQAGPASRCPWHQQRMGDICYKFVRLRNSFWGAQAWCQANGGCLAHPWNPETQALLSHCLVEGEKWWVGLREHPGEGERSWDLLPLSVLGGGLCGGSSWALLIPLPCCSRSAWAAADLELSSLPSLPRVPPQGQSLRPLPSREQGAPGASFDHTLASSQAVEDTMRQFNQAIRTIHHLPALQRACHTLQRLTEGTRLLSEAAQVAGGLWCSVPLRLHSGALPFSGLSPRQDCLCPGLPAVSHKPQGLLPGCPHCAGNRALRGTPMGALLPWGSSRSPLSHWACGDMPCLLQLTEALENTMAALTGIQTVLWEGSCAVESSVTVTSPVASTMLSSRNASTLPWSSYHLAQPVPLTLAFPSASAWGVLLSKHPRVQVRVTVLAVNPFKHLDGKEIGSIGNIFLTANKESIQVQDLPEDIEIRLWRDESAETSPTGLNISTEEFVIEVNITSMEDALILRVLPDVPLPIELYLGYQHPFNGSHSLLNTTLPTSHGQHAGKTPNGPAPHSCRAGAVAQPWTPWGAGSASCPASAVPCTGSVWLAGLAHSLFKGPVLQVGPQSTVSSIQCLCNHLSVFGSSFFVVPRTVNILDTGKLLSKVASNPIGVALLASLLVLHGAVGVWAWRSDRVDMRKVKVTVLADNDPRAHVRYVVQVFTGYRRGAATTAKVVLTLYGTEGRSEPHCLRDPHKPVFERGGLDIFLVTTWSSLGELHNIRLWHDNSGSSPSWYVRQVVVSDVSARRKWHFLCSAWLAVDLGDCQLDQVFPAASRSELLSSRHLFCSALVEKVTHDHLWLSVLTHCPWDPFTRLQRLACCLTLLLCTMLINIMFWRDSPEAGRILLTWQELVTSVQTALILLPINLVIGQIFQLVPPQELPLPPTGIRLPRASAPPQEELKATVGFLSRTKLCLEHEALPQEMDSVPELVRSLCCLVGSHLRRGMEPAEPCLVNGTDTNGLLLGATPLRLPGPMECPLSALTPQTLPPCSRGGRSFPISEPRGQKATIPFRLLRETLFICWVTVAATSLASAYFTILLSLQLDRQRATSWVISMLLSLLQNIFIMQPLKVKTLGAAASAAALTRLSAARCPYLELPGTRDWNDPIYHPPCPRPAAPRRGRTWKKKKLYTQLGEIVAQLVLLASLMVVCYTERSPHELYFNEAIRKSITPNFHRIRGLGDFYGWAHGTLLPSLDGPHPGESHPPAHATGTHQGLPCPQSGRRHGQSREQGVISRAERSHLLLPLSLSGAFLPSVELQSIHLYSGSGLTQLTCAQGIYILLLLFYTWVQGRRLKQQKWRYFSSQRNVLDISIIFISLAAFGVYIKCRLLQKSVMEKYHQDRSRFVSFYETAQVASAFTYLLAFLVALAMGKLWNLLCLNPRMHLISSTLRRAWQEVLDFLLVLLVLLAGYSMACNLLFGWSIANYKTFFSSSVTIVGLLIGIFNYDTVINLDPVLGSLLITTSVISMLYVVINLFVSGLLSTFSKERASARVGTDLGLHTQALPQACGGWAGGSLTQNLLGTRSEVQT